MTREEYNDISAALDRIMKRVADEETLPQKAAIGAFGVLGGFQLFIKEYYEKHSTATPQGLDEAAEEYARQYTENDNGNGGDDWEDDIRITFEAGAKWMAERGWHEEAIIKGSNDVVWLNYNVELPIDLAKFFKDGDKVIVQIRKKEE